MTYFGFKINFKLIFELKSIMIQALPVAVCFFLVGLSSQKGFSEVSESSNLLMLARKNLKLGKFDLASKQYAEITNVHPQWVDRVEDSIRFNFAKRRYTESWRVSQAAKRSGTKVSHLDYYLALAATKAGACPFGIRVDDPVWRSLLFAHAYRFPQRFRLESYYAQPYDDAAHGILQSYLGPNRTFYMKDIPRAKVIKKMGCRFLKSRLKNRTVSATHEYRHLKFWFNSTVTKGGENKDLPGGHEIRLRLMDLAHREDDKTQLQEILEKYTKLSQAEWLEIKAPENRFVFNKLIL